MKIFLEIIEQIDETDSEYLPQMQRYEVPDEDTAKKRYIEIKANGGLPEHYTAQIHYHYTNQPCRIEVIEEV